MWTWTSALRPSTHVTTLLLAKTLSEATHATAVEKIMAHAQQFVSWMASITMTEPAGKMDVTSADVRVVVPLAARWSATARRRGGTGAAVLNATTRELVLTRTYQDSSTTVETSGFIDARSVNVCEVRLTAGQWTVPPPTAPPLSTPLEAAAPCVLETM